MYQFFLALISVSNRSGKMVRLLSQDTQFSFFFFPLMLCHLIVEESYREHLEVQLLTFI